MNKKELINELLNDYDKKIIALAQHLNINMDIDEEYNIEELKEELNNIKEGYTDNIFEYYNEEYEVLTDNEADERWEEELQNYTDECIIPELSDFATRYFNKEAWKRDARFDGRGHSISRYDGCEHEEKVNDTWFYIYRQN